MSRRWSPLLTLAWVVMVVAACDPSGAADSVVQSSSSTPSTATSFVDPSSTTTAVTELRPEFLMWVAPIDFEELAAGWEAFGRPDQEPKFMAMADCWEENGYVEFAGHLRDEASVMPGGAGDVLLTPMRRLRDDGFAKEPDFWIPSIAESVGPKGLPSTLPMLLEYGPDVGLRLEDVAGIRRVGEMCWPEGWILTSSMGIPDDVDVQWITRLGEIDQEPELTTLIKGTVTPCLRSVDPYFKSALDPGDWVSRAEWAPKDPQDVEGYDSEMWAMPEQTLVEWGRAFAGCMELLEEARRAPRLAAREVWVDQWYDQLIDFQARDGLQTGGG